MDLPYDPVIPLLDFIQKTQNTNLKEYMHLYVHCSVIYNSQAAEAAQVSISKRVDKTAMVHLHDGIRLNWENFILCDSMDGPGEYYAKWNKSVRERKIPYDFTHMWNLMKKLNWQANRGRLIESRLAALGGGLGGGRMDTDNSVMIALGVRRDVNGSGRGYRG